MKTGITILGQNINLIRPRKIARPITSGAWKGARVTSRKTRPLTLGDKTAIAIAMGFKLTNGVADAMADARTI